MEYKILVLLICYFVIRLVSILGQSEERAMRAPETVSDSEIDVANADGRMPVPPGGGFDNLL